MRAFFVSMAEISATNAKNKFGEVLEMARKEPVTIHKNGRPAAVLIDAEQYEALLARASARNPNAIVEKLLARSVERRRSLYEALAK